MQAGIKMGYGYLIARTGEQVVSELRVRLYDHLQSLPLPFYHERRKGEILALLTRDVERLSDFISSSLVPLVPLGLTFCGVLLLMLRIDVELGALAGVMVPSFFLVVKFIGRHVRPLSAQVAEAYAKTLAAAEENLRLLPVIKAFTRERHASREYEQHTRRLLELSNRYAWALYRLHPAVEFMSFAGIVMILWLASQRVVTGDLTPGQFVSFFLYGLLLTSRERAGVDLRRPATHPDGVVSPRRRAAPALGVPGRSRERAEPCEGSPRVSGRPFHLPRSRQDARGPEPGRVARGGRRPHGRQRGWQEHLGQPPHAVRRAAGGSHSEKRPRCSIRPVKQNLSRSARTG